jgi:ribonucleotide monophosphatase NagD (HAD superfamily)
LEEINTKFEYGFYMIGDDVENDVGAAQNIGGKGILIYTGKTKYPVDESLGIKADFEAHSLGEIISFLKQKF